MRRVGAWTGTLKNPTECLWRWKPDCRSSFFFSPPAHLCAVTYINEISLHVTFSNQSNSNSNSAFGHELAYRRRVKQPTFSLDIFAILLYIITIHVCIPHFMTSPLWLAVGPQSLYGELLTSF